MGNCDQPLGIQGYDKKNAHMYFANAILVQNTVPTLHLSMEEDGLRRSSDISLEEMFAANEDHALTFESFVKIIGRQLLSMPHMSRFYRGHVTARILHPHSDDAAHANKTVTICLEILWPAVIGGGYFSLGTLERLTLLYRLQRAILFCVYLAGVVWLFSLILCTWDS